MTDDLTPAMRAALLRMPGNTSWVTAWNLDADGSTLRALKRRGLIEDDGVYDKKIRALWRLTAAGRRKAREIREDMR